MLTRHADISGDSLIALRPETSGAFKANYNRIPFLLEHHLHNHPLFELSYIVKAAERLTAKMPDRVYYNMGDLAIGRGWDYTGDHSFRGSHVLERIQTAGAWIILKSVQVLPEYADVLKAILDDIHAASEREYEDCTYQRNISVIVTSPRRKTHYHMDRDCNYLLQIRGSKMTYVFDGRDPGVVTNQELERFYSGDINAATYREILQQKALAFPLTPGTGVHIPVTFPHWVQNDDNISISASINFCFTDSSIPDIYQINHRLRRLGLNPRRAGESPLADTAKKAVAKLARVALKHG